MTDLDPSALIFHKPITTSSVPPPSEAPSSSYAKDDELLAQIEPTLQFMRALFHPLRQQNEECPSLVRDLQEASQSNSKAFKQTVNTKLFPPYARPPIYRHPTTALTQAVSKKITGRHDTPPAPPPHLNFQTRLESAVSTLTEANGGQKPEVVEPATLQEVAQLSHSLEQAHHACLQFTRLYDEQLKPWVGERAGPGAALSTRCAALAQGLGDRLDRLREATDRLQSLRASSQALEVVGEAAAEGIKLEKVLNEL
eukprot:gnl/Dysnectes_brevis/3248_a4064_1034.p1 GENE.gnl/Dysnectes_brevis/3248_a4064_1034~~gnl/Dysnectes_brevis/3248_a4064_1034.p1  ORF type:complete len:255 (-),score=45.99 gnl/Dysnectes_brevis/3248_a4064_1034:12-776(-)